jgi:ABC transport system ATP-binding/permease protein
VTVRPAYLSQDVAELDPALRVLEAVESVRREVDLGRGRTITATQMCERFGFVGNAQWTPVGELSGGERRRLQLLRLLMDEPNVLLLDEPTNDLDIDTLTALEDLLDGWPGTLVVVSHERYFVERVCDDVYAITASGDVRHVPGGIDQYLVERDEKDSDQPTEAAGKKAGMSAGRAARAARKDTQRAEREVKRLERSIEKLVEHERGLHEQMEESASDHGRLAELQSELETLAAEREQLEAAWVETSESLEG